MYIVRTLRHSFPDALRAVHFTSLHKMSTTHPLYTSASLKAANAQPFSIMKGKLDASLLQGLDAMGFEYMTPVQKKVLGGLPSLTSDCLVQAKTGTGKTIAFLLPALHTFLTQSSPRGQVSILIMSPTRELALQIAAEASHLVVKVKRPVEIHTAFGGTARASNLNRFMAGDPKILIATPGRLKDYLSERETRQRFNSLQTLILDEADVMLEAGFLPDILSILQALPPKDKARWQGMCFSATVPPKIKEVLSNVLNEDYTSISTLDASEPPTLAGVLQYSVIIPSVMHTFNALLSLLTIEIGASKDPPKIIVFGTTAHLVALYAQVYQEQTQLKVYELHSRLSQPQRTRTTSAFKDAESGIMFATDVIGRGMDFPNVTLVVQVGLPSDSDAYTHRVGRTARAGKDGRAVIVLTEAESYFVHTNRQFPIKIHPSSKSILGDVASAEKVSHVMTLIDDDIKRKAYSAYLGFMKTYLNKLQLNPAGLVKMARELALDGMKCVEVPQMEKKTVGKMGLKGVPGLRIAKPMVSVKKGDERRILNVDNEENDGRIKRARHQGAPEPVEDKISKFDFGNNNYGGQSRGGHGGGSRSRGNLRGAASRGGRGGLNRSVR